MRFALSFLTVALLSGCHENPEGNAGAVNSLAIEMGAQHRQQEWAPREALYIPEGELNWNPGETFTPSHPQFAEFNDDVNRWRDRDAFPTQAIPGAGFQFRSEKSFAGVQLNGASAWQRSVAATEPTK